MTNSSTPAIQALTANLPALPEPDSYCTHEDSHEYDVFDADAMRSYALSAIAADRAFRAASHLAPLPPNLAWRDHDAAIDSKALATATEIALMWGQDRSQFVSRIQVAVTDAMLWLKPALRAPALAASPPAPLPEPLRQIQQHLSVMMGSAIPDFDGGSDGDVMGYRIRTGALHKILGLMGGIGLPVIVPALYQMRDNKCCGHAAKCRDSRCLYALRDVDSHAAPLPPAEEARPAGLPKAQEPKYTVSGDSIVNRVSGEPIPADEPVFIFRARDRHAIKVLDFYSRLCLGEHYAAVRKRMKHFRQFVSRHPERMKEPDTHAPEAALTKPTLPSVEGAAPPSLPWRDISSAPKDGTSVLVPPDGSYTHAFWQDGGWWWHSVLSRAESDYACGPEPKGWLPVVGDEADARDAARWRHCVAAGVFPEFCSHDTGTEWGASWYIPSAAETPAVFRTPGEAIDTAMSATKERDA